MDAVFILHSCNACMFVLKAFREKPVIWKSLSPGQDRNCVGFQTAPAMNKGEVAPWHEACKLIDPCFGYIIHMFSASPYLLVRPT